MAEKKKRHREESSRSASRKVSSNMVTSLVHSERGKLKIGNYTLGITLGHGTFGKVKRKYGFSDNN